MLRSKLAGLNKKTLRRWLTLFFLALAIPTAILIQQSYSRLKWETFHQHQLAAGELAHRIDSQFSQLINIEEQRPFTDYAFLNVTGELEANFLQPSPLSRYPVSPHIPGLIGYFQVDDDGEMMTPLIPDKKTDASQYGITSTELMARVALQNTLQQILSQNNLVDYAAGGKFKFDQDVANSNTSVTNDDAMSLDESDIAMMTDKLAPAPLEVEKRASVKGQGAFDLLNKVVPKSSPSKSAPSKTAETTNLGRLDDIKLRQRYKEEQIELSIVEEKEQQAQIVARKQVRTEQNRLPESVVTPRLALEPARSVAAEEGLAASGSVQTEFETVRVRTFESEIDPFEFSQLDSGHFVLFRKVWLNEQRYVQGLLIDQTAFLEQQINSVFRETALSQMSDLLVVYQEDVLKAFTGRTSRGYLSSARELSGELLYQTRLSAPLSEMQLLFSVTQLPAGPGGKVILWLALIMTSVLLAGFYLMYRLGAGQINLANQQQDFVSAVSHELKTPLTSIRMYGEMLKQGWASEDKKESYYNFIFDESERLSRLINNVLHLASMTRNDNQPIFTEQTVAALMEDVQSKVTTQAAGAGFTLNLLCDDSISGETLNVDMDWFAQIMINLVDNAIKFASQADKKEIDLACQKLSNGRVQFSVRDYGPGIDKTQMKKIFKLFYRSENELTRETVGTGIGLALVHQMTVNMQGKIDIVNAHPGAEFRLVFPTKL